MNANNKISTINYMKYLLLILLIFFVFFAYYLINEKSEEKKQYIDDWAIYNYGQTINGSKGQIGIDINILPILNKVQDYKKTIVAVVDSGIDYSNTILHDKMYINSKDYINKIDDDNNGFIDDYYGWNFYDNNNSVYEDALYDYHGTYIATTISKISPCAQILSVKFLKSTSGSSNDAVAALQYAIDRGARIINCSWNFNEKNDDLYEVMKENPQVLFVCAAGNLNINLDKDILFPCSYNLENVISVMAIDNRGQPYDASGYGKNVVDIGAPGVDVKAILPENEETFINGTSIATAYVTGITSILLSKNENLAPYEIKNIIITNSRKIDELASLCKSNGIIDATACFKAVN